MNRENTLRKQDMSAKQNTNLYYNYVEYASLKDMPVIHIEDLMEENIQKVSEPESKHTILNNNSENNSLQEIRIINNSTNFSERVLTLSDLDDLTKSQSVMLADKILDEAHRIWTRQSVVKSIFISIDRKNAYSFIRSMLNISDTRSVLGDIKKYITFKELKHFLLSFIKQAEDVGFKDSYQYKELKKEYDNIIIKYSKHPSGKANNETISVLNRKIENLYEKMTRKR